MAGPGESSYSARRITPWGEVPSQFYVSLSVLDAPGVLAKIAAAFAHHDVSIQAVRQESVPGNPAGQGAKLAIMTHTATVAQLRAAVAELESMPDVHEPVRVMRVEGQG